MLFTFSTKNSNKWCGDLINYYYYYYYYYYYFNTFSLSLIFHWSKFDKNMVALRFKDLHIVS